MKLDVFAHVLPPRFYSRMLEIEPKLPQKLPFIQHPLLSDIEKRVSFIKTGYKQVISNVNVNPEDYVDAELAIQLCREGNEELTDLVKAYPEQFETAIGMIDMNNIGESLVVMKEIATNPYMSGIQLFTRALGKSLAHEDFYPVFEQAERLNLPILLHPVFDPRKPDNNIVFSWEYEISQAMLDIVEAGLFQKFSNLKIIVHHAGAMIPFFSERIRYILPEQQSEDFKKFYVDTALLGNTKALELTVDYFGVDHVLFGTDAPLGILPAGATDVIVEAIEQLPISVSDKEKIYHQNAENLFGGH